MAESDLTRGWTRQVLLWLLRRRRRYRVSGDSMSPLLEDGDVVLVNPRAYRHNPPSVGDVVLARHPYDSSLHPVKRVAAVLDDGRLQLLGENPAQSTDSRSWGAVAVDRVLGRVELKL